MHTLFLSLAGSVVLAAPSAHVADSSPITSALTTAYARLDAAYRHRNVPGIMEILSSEFVDQARDTPEGRPQARARLEDFFHRFGGVKTIEATTRVGSVSPRGGHVTVTVLRRVVTTYAAPPPEMPVPLVEVDSNVETWAKTPAGWRLTRMEDTPLRHELRRMIQADQDVRIKYIRAPQEKGIVSQMEAVDAKDTARMKQVIATYGWPGYSQVGSDGSHDAWLLVQHADADRPFQKKCLGLLQRAVAKDEADKSEFAYLTDRVLTGEHLPQLYGTQFADRDGTLAPLPIKDAANVDKRRAAMGMGPLADYLKMAQQFYHPAAKARAPCGG